MSLLGMRTGQPVLRGVEGQQLASGQKATAGQEHIKELSERLKAKNDDARNKKAGVRRRLLLPQRSFRAGIIALFGIVPNSSHKPGAVEDAG